MVLANYHGRYVSDFLGVGFEIGTLSNWVCSCLFEVGAGLLVPFFSKFCCSVHFCAFLV